MKCDLEIRLVNDELEGRRAGYPPEATFAAWRLHVDEPCIETSRYAMKENRLDARQLRNGRNRNWFAEIYGDRAASFAARTR